MSSEYFFSFLMRMTPPDSVASTACILPDEWEYLKDFVILIISYYAVYTQNIILIKLRQTLLATKFILDI